MSRLGYFILLESLNLVPLGYFVWIRLTGLDSILKPFIMTWIIMNGFNILGAWSNLSIWGLLPHTMYRTLAKVSKGKV